MRQRDREWGEVLGKDRVVADRGVDAGTVVIRHGREESHLDIGALGCQREAVDDGFVGFVVRAKEEA